MGRVARHQVSNTGTGTTYVVEFPDESQPERESLEAANPGRVVIATDAERVSVLAKWGEHLVSMSRVGDFGAATSLDAILEAATVYRVLPETVTDQSDARG
jgi:hypothetical protein